MGISQVPESKGIWFWFFFFFMARELLGVYHCGSPVPEVTWVGNGVFGRAALGYPHGESLFIFLGMLWRELHSKQEQRKENPLAQDKP